MTPEGYIDESIPGLIQAAEGGDCKAQARLGRYHMDGSEG